MARKRRRQVAWDETGTEATRIGGISDEDYVSRSTRRDLAKKEIENHHILLEQCINLDDEAWIGFDLSSQLIQSFNRLKLMKGSGARQRLLKHVRGSIQESSWDTLQEVDQKATDAQERSTKRAMKREAWCNRLIREGEEALMPAQTRFPQADIHILRTLIFQIQRKPNSSQAQGSRKLLLQCLTDWDDQEKRLG